MTGELIKQQEPGLYAVEFGGGELFWVKIAEDGTVTAGKGTRQADVIPDVDGWVYVKGDGIDACINIRPDSLVSDMLNAKWVTLWESGTPKPRTGFEVGGNPDSFAMLPTLTTN